ncbi:MAG: prolyl oligopeptidase family serine peptidase, partial [Actinomycetota bacterium]
MPRLLRNAVRIIACVALSVVVPVLHAATQTVAKPPVTRVEVVRETLHGQSIEDPYRWLEKKDAPETRAWVDAQNAYTHTVLDPVPGRDRIHARLAQLMKVDAQGTPLVRGSRYFYTRRLASQTLSVLYVREGLEGKERVLIDPHPLSVDHTTTVSFQDVSDDGRLMAYGTRLGGEDEVSIAFRDVDTGVELADRMPRARYFGVSLTADKRGVYYSRHTPEGSRVYFHAMGSDPSGDKLLFGTGYGPEKIINAALSEDRRWLKITVSHGSSTDRSELYVMDVANGGPVVPVVNDIIAYFSGRIAGDRMYLQTNWESSNNRIFLVDLKNPARDQWKEIIPTGDAVIDDFSLVGGRLFVNYLKNVVSSVRTFDADGRPLGTIEFPTLGAVGRLNGRWAQHDAFFTFTSYHVPTTIYHYDTAT